MSRIYGERKTLRLDGDRRMLVFHGLGDHLAHAEAMAAIDFHYVHVDPRPFVSRETIKRHLKEMRTCHEMRAELVPFLFEQRAARSI